MEESPFLAAKESLNTPRIRPYKNSKECLFKKSRPGNKAKVMKFVTRVSKVSDSKF
jgi:hypothetical protein